MKPLLSSIGLIFMVFASTDARSEEMETSSGGPPDALSSLKISGFAQLDYLKLDRSLDEIDDGTGDLLNENQFTIRRARLRVDKHWGNVGVSSITELVSGTKVQQVGLEVLASLKPLSKMGTSPLIIRAGLFPVPFGYESYNEPAPNRFFGERTLFVESFIPGRFDVGAALSGHVFNIDWILAIQNGEPLGSNYAYRDPNNAKDVTARVQAHGKPLEHIKISFGTSFLKGTGFSPGTTPTKDSFEWRDLNEDGRVLPSELVPIPGASGRPSQNYNRWGVGVDVQLEAELAHLGKSFLYGECAFGTNLDRGVAPADPILLGRDQRGFGAYLALVQELTKHATLGIRYEHYEPNKDALELQGGITVVSERRFRTLTTGLSYNNLTLKRAKARVLVEYESQDNRLGRDPSGKPANLDNDTLRVRLETTF